MRKFILALVGLGIVAVVFPTVSANAEDSVVVKGDHDHGRDWHRHHKKVVVIKHHRYHDNDRY